MMMKQPFSLLLLVALLAAAPWAGAPLAAQTADAAAPARLHSFPLQEVRRGLTGYGLTVFSGSEPERFEMEVLGVLRNTDPDVSYVLVRLTGHGLESTGVAQGMSGSPVFIDDRLLGAVAFAWPYSTEAIAGITPIESMRSIGELPSGIPGPPDRVPVPGAAAAAGTPPTLAEIVSGDLPESFLSRTLATLRPRIHGAAPGASSALGWVTAGFGDESRGMLDQALGAVAPTGSARAEDAAPLETGGPVAAVLVDGDLQLAATGTVTERHGDEVLAFGHSFLGLGPLSVPMASAEIVTVLPSRYNSFKISNLGPIVGAFEQDAQTGIRGQIGVESKMVPYTLRVEGIREREYHMRLAALPQLLPSLVAAATVGGLEAATFASGPQGIDLDATIRMKDWGELAVRQSFDGPNAASFASSHLVGIVSYLAQNDLREVEIEGIDVTIHQAGQPRLATLVGAHAERTVVRPGEPVQINLELKGYRGETFRRSATIQVPEDASAGKLFLMVGDGASADAARLTLEPSEPVTFAQALSMLRSYHSNRELVVLQVVQASGLSVAGTALPRLPGSIQSIWKAAASGTAQPLSLAVTPVEIGELDFPVEGLVRIDLEVRRREPLVGEPQASSSTERIDPERGPASREEIR